MRVTLCSNRVLEIEPDNGRAWLRKAELHFLADWNFPAAEHAYLRAIELAPDDPMNYLPYSEFLLTLGEFERSEEMFAADCVRLTRPGTVSSICPSSTP